MSTPEMVIVGRLRKAHGIKGDLVVEPITDAPAEVFAAGRRLFAGTATGEPSANGATLVVESSRPLHGGGIIVHFAEIPDRTEAELWRNRYLLAPVAELPPPAGDEVYYHELIGMRVVLSSGEEVGEVREFYELPQGLALEVGWKGGTVVLPFREEFVNEVDRDGRRIVMTLPEGLLE
ncbi:MAG: ribosome maturation factor RimM [Gemmatimonadota bacterium]|nr:ribosome maturation factor RimM [Gemmatimonadota bacterium]